MNMNSLLSVALQMTEGAFSQRKNLTLISVPASIILIFIIAAQTVLILLYNQ
ncbi:hypothetical protein [Piscirickettsia salmonis]|uniref:hypothetical protein n=1 Tax=Piscirickettsia salmonis TaxID=1238 RepID=UPI001E58BF51|nr:hypothetical protein [Piscirickettsia salmonis]